MTEMNENCVIKIENLSKEYRLGAIGSGTLRHDLQSWYAKKRGKEDPNQRIGAVTAKLNMRYCHGNVPLPKNP